MIDYGQQEEKLIDKANIESEVTKLDDHFKIFNLNCHNIDKEILSIKDIYGKEKIMKIGLKFQILKEIIEKIYSSIQFIKNFANHDISKHQKLITTITTSVKSEIYEINGKFYKLAESSKKRIENQILMNKKTYLDNNDNSTQIEENNRNSILTIIDRNSKTHLTESKDQLNGSNKNLIITSSDSNYYGDDIDKVLTEKIKYDIIKLQEIKVEYEKVLMITNQIYSLSKDLIDKSRTNSYNTPNENILQFEVDIAKDDKKKVTGDGSCRCFYFMFMAVGALIVFSAYYFYLNF